MADARRAVVGKATGKWNAQVGGISEVGVKRGAKNRDNLEEAAGGGPDDRKGMKVLQGREPGNKTTTLARAVGLTGLVDVEGNPGRREERRGGVRNIITTILPSICPNRPSPSGVMDASARLVSLNGMRGSPCRTVTATASRIRDPPSLSFGRQAAPATCHWASTASRDPVFWRAADGGVRPLHGVGASRQFAVVGCGPFSFRAGEPSLFLANCTGLAAPAACTTTYG